MRTSLTTAAALALALSASVAFAAPAPSPTAATPPAAAPANAGGGASDQPYTLYSSIPRVAGIKTLIDFNDYDNIIATAKGYVNVRYLAKDNPNGIAGVDNHVDRAAQVGAETGQPVRGFVLDPPHSDMYTDGDPATGADLRERQNPDQHEMRQMTKVGRLFPTPDPSRQGDAYANVINRTAATVAYADLPKDEFGGVVYTLSNADMALDNWLVELNSSANTIQNRRQSYAKTVTSFAAEADGKYREFLGVRVRFPTHGHNANARIAPSFPIPAFDARGFPINYGFFDPDATDANNPFKSGPFATTLDPEAPTHASVDKARVALEALADTLALSSSISYNGVIHNVSDIREMVVRVAGRNYRNGLAMRLRDQNGDSSEYFMGYVDFVGWHTLRWVNPNYVPADEMEPFRLPLYPTEIPYVAFDSFVVYRNGTELGGDFVVYFDYVKMDYDLAVPAAQLEITVPGFIDIADDDWWYILRDRNQAESRLMMREFSRQMDLRRQALGRTTRHSEGEAPVETTDFPKLRDRLSQ